MRGSLLLTAAALLASSSFAQSARPPIVTEPPPASTTSPSPTNYRFHAQFAPDCCGTGFGFADAPASTSVPTPQWYGSTRAVGSPDFQPSSYVPFPDAVAAGEEQAANSPFAQSKNATVQQMLDLVQATRAAQQQTYDDGDSAPVKWSDLKPGINPSDYLKSPSTYMKYKDAVALGREEAQAEAQQPPSLGEVAGQAKDARPADAKPAVVIKQDAHGTPELIHKGTPAQRQQPPDSNSQPQ
jgi:hypothetical protein